MSVGEAIAAHWAGQGGLWWSGGQGKAKQGRAGWGEIGDPPIIGATSSTSHPLHIHSCDHPPPPPQTAHSPDSRLRQAPARLFLHTCIVLYCIKKTYTVAWLNVVMDLNYSRPPSMFYCLRQGYPSVPTPLLGRISSPALSRVPPPPHALWSSI